MLKRLYHRIRNHFRSEESKWAEARQVAYYCRDMAREELGIDISDEDIELQIRFYRAVERNLGQKCFDEFLRGQMYAYLTPERRRQIVHELEGMK